VKSRIVPCSLALEWYPESTFEIRSSWFTRRDRLLSAALGLLVALSSAGADSRKQMREYGLAPGTLLVNILVFLDYRARDRFSSWFTTEANESMEL